MRSGTLALVALLGFTALPDAAHAQFLGTSATGTLQLRGGGLNVFDPNIGYAPDGYLNKTQGTTVTVADPAIEFGFQDAAGLISVNITNSTITVTDLGSSNSVFVSPTITLTDTAFAGLTFYKVSDTFALGLTYTLTGNTLSLNFSGGVGPFTAVSVLSVTPNAVPEPGSIALLTGLTLSGAAFLRRRKQVSKAA